MTTNYVQTGKGKRRVSFAEEQEADRSDSTQEHRRSIVTNLATRLNKIETTSYATTCPSTEPRRPSLTVAIAHASTHIGDGLCESKKELAMLGVLPDPESSDDDGSSAPVNMPSREEDTVPVIPATIPEDEELYDGGVSPKDTSSKGTAFPFAGPSTQPTGNTIGPISTVSVSVSKPPNLEAERNEERNIRSSFQRFTFPPPSTTHGQQDSDMVDPSCESTTCDATSNRGSDQWKVLHAEPPAVKYRWSF